MISSPENNREKFAASRFSHGDWRSRCQAPTAHAISKFDGFNGQRPLPPVRAFSRVTPQRRQVPCCLWLSEQAASSIGGINYVQIC